MKRASSLFLVLAILCAGLVGGCRRDSKDNWSVTPAEAREILWSHDTPEKVLKLVRHTDAGPGFPISVGYEYQLFIREAGEQLFTMEITSAQATEYVRAAGPSQACMVEVMLAFGEIQWSSLEEIGTFAKLAEEPNAQLGCALKPGLMAEARKIAVAKFTATSLQNIRRKS